MELKRLKKMTSGVLISLLLALNMLPQNVRAEGDSVTGEQETPDTVTETVETAETILPEETTDTVIIEVDEPESAEPEVSATVEEPAAPQETEEILPEETAGASRKHCVVTVADDRFYIMDVGSTCGTIGNGTQKLPVNQPVILNVGDRISLGENGVSFEIISVPDSSAETGFE